MRGKILSVHSYQEMVGGGELKALQFMMTSTPSTTGYSWESLVSIRGVTSERKEGALELLKCHHPENPFRRQKEQIWRASQAFKEWEMEVRRCDCQSDWDKCIFLDSEHGFAFETESLHRFAKYWLTVTPGSHLHRGAKTGNAFSKLHLGKCTYLIIHMMANHEQVWHELLRKAVIDEVVTVSAGRD